MVGQIRQRLPSWPPSAAPKHHDDLYKIAEGAGRQQVLDLIEKLSEEE